MGKLISIVIPTFNEQKTIGECLKSLKNQTYKPIEITVVDDGSSDSTRNIVEDSQNIKLLTQGHKGPGQARNLGVANAKGEILVFVDADMTFDKNFIKQLEHFLKMKWLKIGIIFGRIAGTLTKTFRQTE